MRIEFVILGEKTTVCLLKLMNGYEVVGTSACIDPEDFDAELGEKYAFSEALAQLAKLNGYAAHLTKQTDELAGCLAQAGAVAEKQHAPDYTFVEKFVVVYHWERGAVTESAECDTYAGALKVAGLMRKNVAATCSYVTIEKRYVPKVMGE